MAPLFIKNTHEKQQNAASSNLAARKVGGSYQAKSLFFALPNIDMCGCE